EDRHPPRVRRVPRPLHVRERVHDALHRAHDQRRDLLELPPVLHRPAEARRHRRPRRALPAPRRQAQPRRAV
ncbi:MAG: LSU ribosomal protein L31p @ LSU ribosomal protein L31p, zinc-dependent, partial [uncultured Solirubrobacteraceae bacterium]